MKKVLLVFTLVLAVAGMAAGSATSAGPAAKVAPLQPVAGSSVSGVVVIAQLPAGGSFVLVFANGLRPHTAYTSFYYDDNQCMVGPEEVGTFQSNAFGFGFTFAEIDEDVDEVGSVSVRSPDYTHLFACAHLESDTA